MEGVMKLSLTRKPGRNALLMILVANRSLDELIEIKRHMGTHYLNLRTRFHELPYAGYVGADQ